MTHWFRAALVGLIAVCAASLADGALAQTTIGQPSSNGSAGFVGPGSTGQVITVPADRVLTSWTVYLADQSSSTTVTGSVYRWTGTAVTGPSLYTGTQFLASSSETAVTFSTGGVTLDAGSQYLLLVTPDSGTGALVYFQSPGSYSGGYLVTGTVGALNPVSSIDARFSAAFAPAPVTVPTLSEWAMIVFGVVLAGGAVLVVQRRRLTA